MNLLFVYGTLKRGGSNSVLMSDCNYIGDAVLAQNTTLYTNGFFPMMVESSEKSNVKGELYEVPDDTLDSLDHLEGHPHYFERIETSLGEIKLKAESLHPNTKNLIKDKKAYVYFYRKSVANHKHLGESFSVQ